MRRRRTPLDQGANLVSSNTYHTEVHLIRMRVRVEHFRNPKDRILRIESIANDRAFPSVHTLYTKSAPLQCPLRRASEESSSRRMRPPSRQTNRHRGDTSPNTLLILVRVPWALRARLRIGSSLSSSSPRGVADCTAVAVAVAAREEPRLSKKNHRDRGFSRFRARSNLSLERTRVTCGGRPSTCAGVVVGRSGVENLAQKDPCFSGFFSQWRPGRSYSYSKWFKPMYILFLKVSFSHIST